MLTDFYNGLDTTLTIYTHYKNYLDEQQRISGSTKLVIGNREIKKYIDSVPTKLQPILKKNVETVCTSLDAGLKKINKDIKQFEKEIANDHHAINLKLDEIRSEISHLSSLTSWGFSTLIASNKITHFLIRDLAELLKIPDIQKERYYHIEEGLKYLKTGFLEKNINSLFFNDAFNSFHKAIKIEPKDYFSHFQLGIIHLYTGLKLDPAKAVEHFIVATKYALAEDNVSGSTTSETLIAPLYYKNKSLRYSSYKIMAAESSFYAGRALYLEKKYSDAVTFAKKARDIVPEFHLARYEEAKYLILSRNMPSGILSRNMSPGIRIFDRLIRQDRSVAVKLAKDVDLIPYREVATFLVQLKVKEEQKLTRYIKRLNGLLTDQPESLARGKLNEWNIDLDSDYLSLRGFNDLFEATYLWEVPEARIATHHTTGAWYWYLYKHRSHRCSIFDFASLEREYYQKLPSIKKEVRDLEDERLFWKRIKIAASIIFFLFFLKMCGAL